MNYTFKLTRDQREAIYSALCEASWEAPTSVHTLKNAIDTRSNQVMFLELSEEQTYYILQSIQKAIDFQSRDEGDWLRAKDYMNARDYLISETRKQFRVANIPKDESSQV
jgi:hypothetical protein